ncbi:hypothetical protein KPL70_023619 [Citrus sinensis]|nr:hypothetical protein KPL70_023619 [Citrus sinensis]
MDVDSRAKKAKGESSSSAGGGMRSINNKAHSTIILYLLDGVLREVAKENTISSLWTKLEELFLKKSLAKRLYMKRKLYTFSMKERTIGNDHLDEFNKLILDLENVNIILEDKDRALILLSSFSDSYEQFVDTLLYGRQSLTLKDVKNALESKDLKKRTYGKKETNRKVVVASKDEGNSNDADVLVAIENYSSGEWILDSGCSFHTCANKDFFKTFESIDGGKVLLGNNLVCKVARIGTIGIKMLDVVHFKLSKKQEPKEDIDFDYMRKIPSSSVVGSIMYAMVSSRLDVAYGVGLVSKFMENPEDVKEALWLKGLVSKLGLKQELVTVSCDSSSAIQLSKNAKHHERTKHVDVRMHFIRDEIIREVINVVKIPSKVNLVDMLTKPLPTIKFRNSLNLIRIVNL